MRTKTAHLPANGTVVQPATRSRAMWAYLACWDHGPLPESRGDRALYGVSSLDIDIASIGRSNMYKCNIIVISSRLLAQSMNSCTTAQLHSTDLSSRGIECVRPISRTCRTGVHTSLLYATPLRRSDPTYSCMLGMRTWLWAIAILSALSLMMSPSPDKPSAVQGVAAQRPGRTDLLPCSAQSTALLLHLPARRPPPPDSRTSTRRHARLESVGSVANGWR